MKSNRLVIGLTGGIGSGKTMVSNLLGQLGATVVDTDVIAHEICQAGGLAIPALVEAFGSSVLDASGAMDRAAMRARIVADPEQRTRLEHIVHPLIRQVVLAQIHASTGAYCVVVVPLLIEKGWWDHLTDFIVVVDCEPQQQVERVRLRNGWPEEQIQGILRLQATRAERLARADAVLKNTSTPEDLLQQTRTLHETITTVWCPSKQSLR